MLLLCLPDCREAFTLGRRADAGEAMCQLENGFIIAIMPVCEERDDLAECPLLPYSPPFIDEALELCWMVDASVTV